jgi:hypothetical protein
VTESARVTLYDNEPWIATLSLRRPERDRSVGKTLDALASLRSDTIAKFDRRRWGRDPANRVEGKPGPGRSGFGGVI